MVIDRDHYFTKASTGLKFPKPLTAEFHYITNDILGNSTMCSVNDHSICGMT